MEVRRSTAGGGGLAGALSKAWPGVRSGHPGELSAGQTRNGQVCPTTALRAYPNSSFCNASRTLCASLMDRGETHAEISTVHDLVRFDGSAPNNKRFGVQQFWQIGLHSARHELLQLPVTGRDDFEDSAIAGYYAPSPGYGPYPPTPVYGYAPPPAYGPPTIPPVPVYGLYPPAPVYGYAPPPAYGYYPPAPARYLPFLLSGAHL